jgi:hypothetical protein
MRRSDCPLARLEALRASLALPIPCRLPSFVVAVSGSWPAGSPPGPRQGGGVRRLPHPGNCPKEAGGSPKFPGAPCADRPRSQTPVVSRTLARACPGRRPSAAGNASAFPSRPRSDILADHNDTHVGAQARGLSPRSPELRTSMAGFARRVRYRPAGEALVRWDLTQTFSPTASPPRLSWDFSQFPRFGLSWREHAFVRCVGGQGHGSHPPALWLWSLIQLGASNAGTSSVGKIITPVAAL